MHLSSRAVRGAALALVVIGGACGETSDDQKAAVTTVTTASTTTAAAKTVEVTGDDYFFKGVPAKIAPGTVISFTNASKKEVHELVALRVKEGETRPASALLQLPEAERDAAAEFRGVAIAFPEEKAITPEGPVTLTQPGRYLFVCVIPTGADPAAYREAVKNPNPSGPPPSVPGGPPHVANGMVAEVTVG